MASVASAKALNRRRSDRPEILPAQARSDHLLVALRPAQTRRNDATASMTLTGSSGGEASTGWRSVRGARPDPSATAS
jgi:hypothetical protein